MLSFNTRRQVTFLVAGSLAGAAVGCSRDTERPPTLETAAAAAPAIKAMDSGPRTDSTAAVDTPPAPRPVAKPVTTPKPVIKRKTADTTATAQAPARQDQWLKYDAATNTVTFELIGGPRGFEFNGYANGGATLTLPPKATVVMNFVNKDGTPHSAVVIPGEGPLPNADGDPALPRAYTNQLLQGLPQEASDAMRFTAPESGKYRIFCGVPGHGLSGMWIWMVVDPSAKAPSFGPTKQ